MKTNKTGFSLVELLVAIAIIGILAAVVLISMSSYGKRARSTKAVTQLSGMFPGTISCMGNNGDVNEPASGGTGGGNICSLAPSYGQWVSFSGDLANYRYGASNFASAGDWYLRASSAVGNDDVAICCNSTMNSCGIIGGVSTISTCNKDKTW